MLEQPIHNPMNKPEPPKHNHCMHTNGLTSLFTGVGRMNQF